MKWCVKWQRILILFLLSLSVFAPIVFVSNNLKSISSEGRKPFGELGDLLNIIHKKPELLPLHSVSQESRESVKEPIEDVYKDQNHTVTKSQHGTQDEVSDLVGLRTSSDHDMKSAPVRRANERSIREAIKPMEKKRDDKSNRRPAQRDPEVRLKHFTATPRRKESRSESRRMTDGRVTQMKDQLIRARAYLSFAIASSNAHLVKDLRLRRKEVQRALGEAVRDSDLPRSALQKAKSMESTLLKASRVFPDCAVMVKMLRAMMHNAEDQVQSEEKHVTFLSELAGRTTPKGLHCLSMRLTAEYFTLQPEQQIFPNQQNIYDRNLLHYVVFSDNLLAAAVVVNSTVSNALDPQRIVFHVVTDSMNFPAISMWFLLNPPGKATIHISSVTDFHWLSQYESLLEKQSSSDPKFYSLLNHLRFHLPEIFPELDKIVFLDHDVVVQRDLSSLWDVNMKGKVNGVVETCKEGGSSYRRMNTLINFSDPLVASEFDLNTCTWAFGMNLFDLGQWRRFDLTSSYRRFLLKGIETPLWRGGTLPLGWVTFYNQTIALEPRLHLLGLGFDPQVSPNQIEQAAVIHYDGIMKPWLDIGIKNYKGYWNKYVNFDHPYLQQCNLHE